MNDGDLAVSGDSARGILALTAETDSPVRIENSGDITSTSTGADAFPYSYADGIHARTSRDSSPISIMNSGKITVSGRYSRGIYGRSGDPNSAISIENSGDIAATGVGGAYSYVTGISAVTFDANSHVTIKNSGDIRASNATYAIGIFAQTEDADSPILIENSGSVIGEDIGIHTHAYGNEGATIINSGFISAGSLRAIDTYGPANTQIFNSGVILGYVVLDSDDTFNNQKGGTFEARLTSDFGPGTDLFRNEQGATVHAVAVNGTQPSFVNLERFENQGLISTVNDSVGDVFRISNTVGGTNLSFVASNGSTLGVDAFLGGPGSTADNFIIDGNVSGKTELEVNDTNPGPGVLNKQDIPVVYVNGATPKGNEFFLSKPIDTGFFDYDLYFTPTGSGVWSLKSFLGQGAFVLPQLITATQDMWHSGSDTWFDRTADLRVLLNGGAAPAEDPNAKYAEGTPAGTPAPQNFTPAVWARGSGNWLNRDDSESVTAYGRDYRYNLNRDLETVDFQSGIDLGKRGLLSDNDILVFGALGGYIHSNLDYDAINRVFSFDGGQVGGYATYLRGGLFVDTLVNVHLMQIDTRTLGLPNSMNATTVGVRTDAATASAASTAGPSSSRWPRSRSIGPISTASARAATRSRSTTIPMSEDAWACASAPRRKCGPASPPSPSSSAACGAISRTTIRRRSSRPAPPSSSRTISKMCGARSRRA